MLQQRTSSQTSSKLSGRRNIQKELLLTGSSNGGGWSSTGLSCLIGLSSPIWCFIGPDAGAHMSEELKDASITLPKAML
jgi:choline transport protein